jgi:hypothetical protein
MTSAGILNPLAVTVGHAALDPDRERLLKCGVEVGVEGLWKRATRSRFIEGVERPTCSEAHKRRGVLQRVAFGSPALPLISALGGPVKR